MIDAYAEILRREAASFGLDPGWAGAIILQESGGNPFALRMEMAYSYLYKPELYAPRLGLSLVTETTTQKMSWGLGQLMGALLRQLGFSDHMGKAFDPEVNIHYLCTHLYSLSKISSDISDLFAMYNGGTLARTKVNGRYRNQKYVDSANEYLRNLRISGTLLH